VRLGGGGYKTFSTNGNFEVFLADATAANVQFVEQSGFDGTISNISVREIDPLSVSLQMEGRVTYADEDTFGTVRFWRWRKDGDNTLRVQADTASAATGQLAFTQINDATADFINVTPQLSPGVAVAYSIASRHGSTFLQGALDGGAGPVNSTPTGLPDLSATDLVLGDDYMGTIKTFRTWAADLSDTGIEDAST